MNDNKTNKWQLQEFPIDEMAMLQKITSQFNNWGLINIEQDDLIQEVLIKLLEDWTKWETLRNNSTSSTLMYIALKNKAHSVWNSEIKKQLPYSEEDIKTMIKKEILSGGGIVYQTFLQLSTKQQNYITDVYGKNRTYTKTSIKEKYELTWSQVKIAELKITNSARFAIKLTTRGGLI